MLELCLSKPQYGQIIVYIVLFNHCGNYHVKHVNYYVSSSLFGYTHKLHQKVLEL